MSPRLRRALWAALIGIALGCAVLEAAIPDPHHADPVWITYWWSGVPAFYTIVGFAGCIVLVLASKWLGKVWLQRPREDSGA